MGLQIALFGVTRIVDDLSAAEINLGPTVKGLLAFLLLNRERFHRREVLIDLFWGDLEEKRARRCLSTSLWRIRSHLEPEGIADGTYLVTSQAGEVGFNAKSDYWLDVASFEKNAEQGLASRRAKTHHDQALALEKALGVYTADLMEGQYHDWILRERERLHALQMRCLSRLMVYYRRQERYGKSLACGQKILQVDPLREEIHREMMRVYLLNGQRAIAIQQYEEIRDTLHRELDIPPLPETRALYAEIVSTAERPSVQQLAAGEPADLDEALRELDRAMAGLDNARDQLRRAASSVRQLIKKR